MRKLLGRTVAAGAAVAAYSLYEPYRFRLATRSVPARRGAPEISIVHLSDTHVTGRDRARLRFIASIPERLERTPDLVLVTGDLIEGDAGIDPILDAVSGYEARAGMFYVLGSHDYFRSRFKVPTHYFGGARAVVKAPPTDVRRLEEGLAKLGWVSLTNRTEIIELPPRAEADVYGDRFRRAEAGASHGGSRRAEDDAVLGAEPARAEGEAVVGTELPRAEGDVFAEGSRHAGSDAVVEPRRAESDPAGAEPAGVHSGSATIRLTGVDDPYLRRHRTDHIERRAGEDYAIGLTHSPDVVTEYALNGFDLVLAGHTHGGQVRVPGVGALVTNSALPTGLAAGLHKVGRTWLHVSPGVGTSRFTPFRLAARPEITLLNIA